MHIKGLYQFQWEYLELVCIYCLQIETIFTLNQRVLTITFIYDGCQYNHITMKGVSIIGISINKILIW